MISLSTGCVFQCGEEAAWNVYVKRYLVGYLDTSMVEYTTLYNDKNGRTSVSGVGSTGCVFFSKPGMSWLFAKYGRAMDVPAFENKIERMCQERVIPGVLCIASDTTGTPSPSLPSPIANLSRLLSI
ncbi:hypothetical protein M7I_2545 [Glarea lozoyensis 74030]|uniref:Uncharacterized protein n=1 Tax=Glarea lozoyensis (strain ATCC 74030 / MF5533) TaxID=1104152 RepID=H0EJ22_GLAL7|nr:hypothetical protein M7I_2545 [Glarea lozoyensis 74030]